MDKATFKTMIIEMIRDESIKLKNDAVREELLDAINSLV